MKQFLAFKLVLEKKSIPTVDACKHNHNEMWIAIERLDNQSFQKMFNDIRAERIAKSANPLALIAAAQPYSEYHTINHQTTKLKCNIISTRQSAIYQTPRQIGRQNQLHHNLNLSLKKTVIHEHRTAQRGQGKCQKNLARPCKVFQEALKTYQQQNPFELLLQTPGTRLRYHHKGSRETVGSQVCATDWDTCSNSIRDMALAKECQEVPKRVKDYAYHKKDNDVQTSRTRCYLWQPDQADWLETRMKRLILNRNWKAHYNTWQRFRGPHLKNPVLLVQTIGTVQNHDGSNV
ncbi:hypothetical protein Tco_0543965 [Tanacetum coccineum]